MAPWNGPIYGKLALDIRIFLQCTSRIVAYIRAQIRLHRRASGMHSGPWPQRSNSNEQI